ncbi:crossover junction endonuclease MUS81 [Aegilops tauschii subsp. strangulata]|uniref:crossover junction endonuclease MUS81 n=1 Tax=Aegilops tauschii subsp. strangulata TaxID=200361 RepID=UPI003CC8ADB7
MAPLVPKKKRKVNLPENEEVAARIFGKHRSMAAQQPGGFPEHQARALSAAYTGVCAAKEPVRTPGDLARVTGVGGWVVDVMEDSFPGSSLDLSPPRSNTPGETVLSMSVLWKQVYCYILKGTVLLTRKKNTRNKPYVPRMKSAAYAIMITLYREMEKREGIYDEVLKEVDFQTQKQAVPVPLSSAEMSLLAMPSHQSNESFLKAYEVVLILDDRDTFGPRSRRKVVDNIRSQFNIPVEVKHLPVGDALWIARHKELDTDYVLDFIVERKNVEDLLGSIKDNRYKDQKLRLKKCGLRKLIYLVEGDVNTVDGSESVKTAYVLFS